MPGNKDQSAISGYEPGEVLALFTPLQELSTGLYLLHAITDGWIVLRGLIDDEKTEQLILTDREARLPAALLVLFMPVGIQLPKSQLKCPSTKMMH